MTNNRQLVAALALSGLMSMAHADEKEELLKLRNTTLNLIKQLVKQGILSDKLAQDMIEQAEADANKQAEEAKTAAAGHAGAGARQAAGGEQAAGPAAAAGQTGAAQGAVGKEAVSSDEVRVSYVPDFVKDEIRQQVRQELREEVVGDIMDKAKQESWGLPNLIPDWTKRIRMYGDIRLREQSSLMASNNINNLATPFYLSPNAINTAGTQSGIGQNAFLNTKYNQYIARERFRLGFDAQVNDSVDAGMRLTTGNTQNPVSTNQTLGNTGLGWQFAVDRAFIRYNAHDKYGFNWLTLMGGRTPNPFFTGGSEMVMDEDLSFEGGSATLRTRLGSTDLANDFGGRGPSVFGTAGLFPIQAQYPWTSLNSLQKWMFGSQAGLDWGFDNQDALMVAAAYYDYTGIKGIINKNPVNDTCATSPADVTFSVPQYIQGGNTMVGLCYDSNLVTPGLYGLASDFRILDLNAMYDWTIFAPVHLKFSADYAKNLAFNYNKTYNYVSQYQNNLGVSSGNTGWQFRFDVGWEKVTQPGNWNAFFIYRYLESDAVLSSYTDSDFHLGSTNVKGWIFGGNYGLMKNLWLMGRWMSADMITGPAYSMDVVQLDINTRF